MGESHGEIVRKGSCGLARTGMGNRFKQLGGCGIQRWEVKINGLGLQGRAKAALPIRDATRGRDHIFFDDLRLNTHPGGDSTLHYKQLASAYQYHEPVYGVFEGKTRQGEIQRF